MPRAGRLFCDSAPPPTRQLYLNTCYLQGKQHLTLPLALVLLKGVRIKYKMSYNLHVLMLSKSVSHDYCDPAQSQVGVAEYGMESRSKLSVYSWSFRVSANQRNFLWLLNYSQSRLSNMKSPTLWDYEHLKGDPVLDLILVHLNVNSHP